MPDTQQRQAFQLCAFHHGTLECRGDGYLWDADQDVCDLEDLSQPCPRCNTERYLQEAKQAACETLCGSNGGARFSGTDIMRGAFHTAFQENPDVALTTIRTLCPVATWEAVYDGPECPPGDLCTAFKEISLSLADFEAMIPVLNPAKPVNGGLQ